MRNKWNILCLICCMLFVLAACGQGGVDADGNNVSLQGRLNESQIYYATDLELQINSPVSDVDFKVYGPSIYYPEGQAIVTYTTAGRESVTDSYKWADAPGEWFLERVSYSGTGEVYGLVSVEQGVVSATGVATAGTTPYLCKFNKEKTLIFACDLSEYYRESGINYSATESRLEVGSEDRVYLSCADEIWIFNADGSFQDTVSFGSVKDAQVLDFVGDSYRNLYVLYEDSANQNQYVAEIDTEKATVGAVQQTIGLTGLGTTAREGDILGFNQATVYLYGREESALYELFHWAECKLDGYAVYGVHSLADGSIFVAGNGAQGGVASYLVKSMDVSGRGDSESGKIDIIIGGRGQRSDLLSEAVRQFNRDNETYNVVLENYTWVGNENGMARLDGMFTAGLGPDILDLSLCDVESMLEYGYLEDLTLYLEESGNLSEGDFLEFALEEYRVDGILLAIPHHFSMSLLVGNSDFLGEEPGWTMEEVLTLLEENEGNRVFAKEMRRQDIFQYLLYMNESIFVDREAGTCDFDNEIFRRIVDVAEAYPTQYKAIGENEKNPIGLPELENGTGILCQVTGLDFQCMQPYAGALGGKINYIGYPDEEGSGVSAYSFDSFGIASMSPHKEGAWEFLEYYIQYVSAEKNVNYFPTYRPSIQKLANRAIEAGNIGTIWYGYEMWEFKHYRPDQEEMDAFCELLERARPAYFDTTFREIILEELEGYYDGEVTMDDAIESIEKKIEQELESL